jgi:hypothetical protein
LADLRRHAGQHGRRRDFQRQYDRNPARCQRRTVSGETTASASRAFGNNQQSHPSTSLSMARIGGWIGLPLRSTTTCWRNTRTSASSAALDRNRSTTNAQISLMTSDIGAASPDSQSRANRI